MSELVKLIESGLLTPCFKEMEETNAGVAKAIVRIGDKPAFGIILVHGQIETAEIEQAVQAVEDSWQ